MGEFWKCSQHNSMGNTEAGCTDPSHKTRRQALVDQAVEAFGSKDIENGWVDDYRYQDKLREIEAFLRDQVGKAYEAGAKDKEEELEQING